jgi:hypothetical protein
MQLWLIAGGYAAIVAVAAILVLGRYLHEAALPAGAAAGGMYAAGDGMLAIFIACLFLIPTFFLLRVMARFEAGFTTYSQLLLIFSLTAPICLALIYFDPNRMPQMLGFVSLCRLVLSPLILLGIIASRLVARFPAAKKLASCAMLVEGLTLAVAVGLLISKR